MFGFLGLINIVSAMSPKPSNFAISAEGTKLQVFPLSLVTESPNGAVQQ